jgi:hypothetical protein
MHQYIYEKLRISETGEVRCNFTDNDLDEIPYEITTSPLHPFSADRALKPKPGTEIVVPETDFNSVDEYIASQLPFCIP